MLLLLLLLLLIYKLEMPVRVTTCVIRVVLLEYISRSFVRELASLDQRHLKMRFLASTQIRVSLLVMCPFIA